MRDYNDDDERRSKSKSQPRFNKNAFLAEQRGMQPEHPSTPHEPRPAYQDKPQRQDRPQRPERTDRPKFDDPELTMDQFRKRLRAVEWIFHRTFDSLSFHIVSTSFEEQTKLYHIARRQGPRFMEEFARAQREAYNLAVISSTEDAKNKVTETIGKYIDTGDDDFDHFRAACRIHDWFWSYSDDAGVARRGQEEETRLKNIATNYGGIYLVYWNKCNDNK